MEGVAPDVYDKYILAKVILDEVDNNGGNQAMVKRRATGLEGRDIGPAHNNPLLDSHAYKIELEDGTTGCIFEKTLRKISTLNLMMRDVRSLHLSISSITGKTAQLYPKKRDLLL